MKITNVTLAIGAGTLLGVLALVAWLTYAGKDVTDLVTLVVTLVTVVGGSGAVARKVTQAQRAVDEVKAEVATVSHKVNGRMTQLIDAATARGVDVGPIVADLDDVVDRLEDAAGTTV